MKFKAVLFCLAVALLAISVFAQDRGKAEAMVNGKKISIDYGRPNWGGQDRLAGAPVGFVWRLGKDTATHIETTGSLMVGGKAVAAGKYTLWAKRTGENSWSLLFNSKTGVWGFPSPTDGFIAEAPLRFERAADSVDLLTISLAEAKGKAAIKVQWGNAVLSGSFDVK
ncbi:MAG: DUF2911 domain-containing protein [Acidobacteriota bacterium]